MRLPILYQEASIL